MSTLDLPLCRPARLPFPGRRLDLRRFDTREARATFRLALPITLTALLNMGMSVTDAFFVAALGTREFAAVAVASDFYSLVFYLAGGVIAGLSAVLAAAVARGERARARALVRAGLAVTVLLALVGAPLVALQSVPLAALGAERTLLDGGAGYARAMALNLVPMLLVAFSRTVLVAYWLVAAPLGVALVTRTESGALGIWIALALGILCVTLPTLGRLRRLRWAHHAPDGQRRGGRAPRTRASRPRLRHASLLSTYRSVV